MLTKKRHSLLAFGTAVLLSLQTACGHSTGQRSPDSSSHAAIVPAASQGTIGLTASPHMKYAGQPVTPLYRTPRKTVQAARRGFERGAGKTFEILALPLGPAGGVLAGLMTYPIGAVIGATVGAVQAKSTFVDHSIGHLQGGTRMANRIAEEQSIEEAIRDEIVALGRATTRHQFLVLPHERFGSEYVSYLPDSDIRAELAASGVDEIIDIHISDFAFVGEDATNPRIGLTIELRALCYFVGRPIVVLPATYEGRRRTVDAWAANRGELVHDELRLAARTLAEDIVTNHAHVGRPPTVLASAASSKNFSRNNERTFVYPAARR